MVVVLVQSHRSLCRVYCFFFFLSHINDVDTGITSDVNNFADDTKIGKVIIQSDYDTGVLQAELDSLYDWADGIHCKEVQYYSLNDTSLSRTGCERDL